MNLSPREQQIAALLQQGKTNKQIGQSIGLSQHTVRDNISPMFARFNVKNRAALVALLVRGPSGAPISHVASGRPASDRRTSGDRRAAHRSAV